MTCKFPNVTLRGTALIVAGALMVGTTITGADRVRTIVEGLDGPRGIAAGFAGTLVFAEGDGSFSVLIGRHKIPLGEVPPNFIAPAVATRGLQVFVLTAGGAPGSGAATLYRSFLGHVRPLADIGAYQQTDPDPYNLADPPEESNPFGVAALRDGSVLVSDAAANDLLRVFPDGDIVTVARVKPRVVAVPPGLPAEFMGRPVPPAGTMIPSEAVATSITVGADGYYYVGELRGFPATPGTSQIWRIAPNSVNAVCDPAAPMTGPCQRYADGFTSIVDLESARDGSIYVVELVKQSWLQWEMGIAAPIGRVSRLLPGGANTIELTGELTLPGGVAVGHYGHVFVTTPVFGPGKIVRVQTGR
jgi:hypothetical protein